MDPRALRRARAAAGRRVPRRGRRAAARRRTRAERRAARRCAYDAVARDAPLPLPLLRRGKVRDVYAVDDERLLLVASDRVSAFDVVMARARAAQGRGAHAAHRVVAARSSAASCRTTCSAPTPTRSSRAVPALAPHRERARRPRDALPCAPRSFPSSAWCAATSPARRGRSTSARAPWPASRCRPGCARATASIRRASRPRRRPRRGTTRTSRSREVRASARRERAPRRSSA